MYVYTTQTEETVLTKCQQKNPETNSDDEENAFTVESRTPTASSSKRSWKRTRSITDSSKSNSCLLTEEARKEFQCAFEKMSDDQKWFLREDHDGKKIFVEDIMFECGDSLEYEQYVMNLNDL